jgi:hypothetical protein
VSVSPSLRRSVLALVPVVSIAILGGCGGDDSNKPATLPDQGKIILPKPPGEMGKKEKGMDRFGS